MVGHAPLGVTEPFGAGNEGLQKTSIFIEFMALLKGETS